MRSVPVKLPSVRPLVDQVLISGQITRLEHLQLTSILLSAHRVTPEDRTQINRVFDALQAGRVKFSE
jgi:hypothetical protein